jgi:acetoin utilization deacetylase AcuC-like enzyme
MKIIFSYRCLEYRQEGHPESAERVESIYQLLKEKSRKGTDKFEFLKPNLAKEEDILRVHSKNLLNKVKSGNFLSFDCPNYENIFYYSSLSAGAAIKAAEHALNKEYSFSLMRPPGHHASKEKIGGFCYFNNIAIAVSYLFDNYQDIKKAGIIDFDVHHGNGTQDIFLNNKNVRYVSLHQSPHYPGTGLESQDNCFNYPLPSNIEEKEYIQIFKRAISKIKEFNPDIIAVSAGFDAFKQDYLSGINLEIETYSRIARLIMKLNKPVFSVLEGGYSSKIGDCVYAYLKELE